MLFTQHINTLNSGITAIQSRIDELEAILKGLRNDKSNLEAELQTVLTLEGAAESAISQSQSFINAADSMGRTDLIETFWQAMDAMKNGAIAQLPEATPEPTPEPEPTNPIEPDTNPVQAGIITVEATEATEQKPDTVPDANPTQPDTLPDTVPDTTPQNGKQPLSVGSAVFNTKDASMEELKAYVRSFWNDDKIKQHGSLTRRSTWVHAAKQIMNISDYTQS